MIDLCFECNQPDTNWYWCQICNSKRFQKDFDKWTSGNELLDNFIQHCQLKARNDNGIIEWIPYSHFRNIEKLARGGFSTVYKAIWLDGNISGWSVEKQKWLRFSPKLNDEDYETAKQKGIELPLHDNEKNGFGRRVFNQV